MLATGTTTCPTIIWQPVQRKVEHKTEEVVEELVDAAEKLPMFKQAGLETLDSEMRENLVIMCEESTLYDGILFVSLLLVVVLFLSHHRPFPFVSLVV